MSTAGAVKSLGSQATSQGGGFRSSVSTSIKSSPVRMISIGPEGGRARVDTSFGNPFSRMRPANPSLNPGGKIFGENGPARSSEIERTPIPSVGSINFKRPTPRVGFTPESAAKADIGATFAKARARNQDHVADRKANLRISESANQSANSVTAGNRPDQPIRQLADPLTRPIDFKAFQTIPQAKEQAQISGEIVRFPNFPDIPNSETVTRPTPRIPLNEINTAGVRNALNRSEVLKERPESVRFAQILRDWRYLPTEAISTNRLVRTIGAAEESRRVNDRIQIRLKTAKAERVVQPSLAERPQSLPQLTIEKVRSFSALQPLVDKGVISEEQAMQRAGVISQPHVDIPKPAIEPKPAVRPRVEGVSAKQADILATMAPIIREGSSEAKAQVYQATGINSDLAQRFIQELGTTTKAVPQVEIPPPTPEQAAVQQALQVVRLPELGVLTGVETETEIKNRALALIGVIRQTQQLSALGNTEADNAQLIERQLAELVPQKLRAQVSSFLVKMIRQTAVEKPAEDPSKKGLHQVDLETQNKRVKVVTKGIDTAPQNDKGEIDRDYVIDMVKTDKESKLSRLARQLKQNFDGSRDYLLIAIQNAQKWVSPQELARVADNAMYDRPAVESAEKQSTREVGRKEVGTVMDPMWAEMVRSLIRTLIITPQLTPVRA